MAKLHFRGSKGKAASEEKPQRRGNLSTSLEKQKNMNFFIIVNQEKPYAEP